MSKYYSYKDYNEYLSYQSIRSMKTRYVTRRNSRIRNWIYNKMKEFDIYGESILCLGVRDISEIEFFKEKNYEVYGIDLYKQVGVITCDMSRMYEHFVLKNKKFDIVYADNSLEHCLDLEGFIKGLNLVCKKYFVCFSPCFYPKGVVNSWDCSFHPFMENVEDLELYKKDLEKYFIEFDVILNEFYPKKNRLFFILKKKSFEKE